jgi:cytochrome c peroxidase
MRKYGIVVGTAVTLAVCGVLAARLLLQPPDVAGQPPPPVLFGPIPCQGTPSDTIMLTPVEQLGKLLIYDCQLSDPPATISGPLGYACATCHQPEAGLTSPFLPGASEINEFAGPMPGVRPGRFGHRRPQTYSYAVFSPEGPYFDGVFAMAYVGGQFWDGRAVDLAAQAREPLICANEMANTPTNGIYPPVLGGYSALVSEKATTKYRQQFEEAFGPGIIERTTREEQYILVTTALAAFEASPAISGFSSKWDGSKWGVPPMNLHKLTRAEERGRKLFFGKAICNTCHSSANDPPVSTQTNGKESFTMYCYANIGVPRNPLNPYYQETDCIANPHGCNPMGYNFVDYGLGANPNPGLDGTQFFINTPGDVPQFRGLFKTPTIRNVNKRPSPNFVKAYMHNGVFKSLAQVVQFYNKRNVAVNAQGQEVVFDLTVGPPPGYTPLFAPPEVLDNVQNAAGMLGCIGNLGLTNREEADLVAFLQLHDEGFLQPSRAGPNPYVQKAKDLAEKFSKRTPVSK